MIRRFNYTRRRRIEQWRVGIEIYDTEDDEGAWFSAVLNLEDMGLPPDAWVIIEAKRERFLADSTGGQLPARSSLQTLS